MPSEVLGLQRIDVLAGRALCLDEGQVRALPSTRAMRLSPTDRGTYLRRYVADLARTHCGKPHFAVGTRSQPMRFATHRQ